MDDKRWWDILSVGCPRDVDHDEWYETLQSVLVKLPPDDILAFDVWFDDRTHEANREDLWIAASLINGGASDDGFYYFCCWLVGMGKEVFHTALRDPDSLADVIEPATIYEAEIYSVASSAWAEATGRSVEDFYPIREAIVTEGKGELVASDWENSAEGMRRHLPRLWAIAGEGDNED